MSRVLRLVLVVSIVFLAAVNYFAGRRGGGVDPPAPASQGPVSDIPLIELDRQDRTPDREQPLEGDGWRVTELFSAHYALIIKVEVERPLEFQPIAEALVEPVRERFGEVLVYVYRPGEELAFARVQWTGVGGYEVIEY